MKVLVVGGGGREHALCWKIAQSPLVDEIFCAPGNAGTQSLVSNVDISATDLDGLCRFAKDQAIDLTVVGPEDPLCAGLADRLREAGIATYGPGADGARLYRAVKITQGLNYALFHARCGASRVDVVDDGLPAQCAVRDDAASRARHEQFRPAFAD